MATANEPIRTSFEESQQAQYKDTGLLQPQDFPTEFNVKFSDEQLREILSLPPEKRDKNGKIIDLDLIYKYLPRRPDISDEEASIIFEDEVIDAVLSRVKEINPIWGHTFDDDNRLILLHDAADKDPELPEVLQNLPTIGLLYGPDPEKSEHEGSSDSQP